MKRILIVLGIFIPVMICSFSDRTEKSEASVYIVSRLKRPMNIDGNWDKSNWRKVREIAIDNYMGSQPAFRPVAKAKMMYDRENLYLIFRVEDRYVRIKTQNFNGPVSGDACVEFFFSPDSDFPLRYFNLEINAGGTSLMAYHYDGIRKNLDEQDFKKVEIAHTMPTYLDQEIDEPIVWTIECKLPIDMLKKFSNVTQPHKNTVWKANFYKTSSKSTNPHYITWSVINYPKPQFHLPQFFGTLKFQ